MGLTVENLDKEYPTRSGALAVLSGINLTLNSGEAMAVMGPSGSGKSTLLNILGTLETPTRGRVTVDGIDPFGLSEPRLAEFRNRHVGFVFQDHHLLPQCSVLENVLVPTLVARDGDHVAFEAEARRLLD
jgi:lipoprotein-releasing system ATP-binding protein